MRIVCSKWKIAAAAGAAALSFSAVYAQPLPSNSDVPEQVVIIPGFQWTWQARQGIGLIWPNRHFSAIVAKLSPLDQSRFNDDMTQYALGLQNCQTAADHVADAGAQAMIRDFCLADQKIKELNQLLANVYLDYPAAQEIHDALPSDYYDEWDARLFTKMLNAPVPNGGTQVSALNGYKASSTANDEIKIIDNVLLALLKRPVDQKVNDAMYCIDSNTCDPETVKSDLRAMQADSSTPQTVKDYIDLQIQRIDQAISSRAK